MRDNNRRGPRVMHGAHTLLAQAAASALPHNSVRVDPVQMAAAKAQAETLTRRLRVAELRVSYVERCLTNFEDQAARVQEGNPLRMQAEVMCKTLRELLASADKAVPT